MATGYNKYTERSYWDVYCYPCNKVMEFSTPPRPAHWSGWILTDWTDIEGHYPINALSNDARAAWDSADTDKPKEQKRLKQPKSTTAINDKKNQRKRLKTKLKFRPNKVSQARRKGQI